MMLLSDMPVLAGWSRMLDMEECLESVPKLKCISSTALLFLKSEAKEEYEEEDGKRRLERRRDS